MHVAYNMIHPGTYTVHKEFRDYWIRDKLCRELEREYGLHIDNGREQLGKDRINDKAAAMEAHSGQQSFVSYAKSHAEDLQAGPCRSRNMGGSPCLLLPVTDWKSGPAPMA